MGKGQGGGRGSAGKSLGAIQRLLAERVQIERWLERLSLAGDKTPEAVREKVSRDYAARLNEVNKELKAYGDELEEALKRAGQTRDRLAKQETEAQEKIAEAEVRHAVGEYDEGKWRQVNAEMLQALVRVREELKNANEEVARLEEVVHGVSEAEQQAAAAPTSDAPPPSRPGAPVDELAFLKSVTEDENAGPSPSRASGTQHSIDVPVSRQSPSERKPERGKKKADLGASGVAPIAASGPGKGLAATMDKSLKCKECGTMNLPTEWYCESCGAELSAI